MQSSSHRSPLATAERRGSPSGLSGRAAIVVGASRGIGRGIATAFADAGARVIAVSRTVATFPHAAGGSGTIEPEVADASDPTVPASLLDRYDPEIVVLVAGASPHMRPLHWPDRRSAAAMPAPRPRSASSPPMHRMRRTAPAWA